MRRQERKRGPRVPGYADLEGIEPRNREMEMAECVDKHAGNNSRRVYGEFREAPRGPRPVRASHDDVVATREAPGPAVDTTAPGIEPEQQETGHRTRGVGGIHSS